MGFPLKVTEEVRNEQAVCKCHSIFALERKAVSYLPVSGLKRKGGECMVATNREHFNPVNNETQL